MPSKTTTPAPAAKPLLEDAMQNHDLISQNLALRLCPGLRTKLDLLKARVSSSKIKTTSAQIVSKLLSELESQKEINRKQHEVLTDNRRLARYWKGRYDRLIAKGTIPKPQ